MFTYSVTPLSMAAGFRVITHKECNYHLLSLVNLGSAGKQGNGRVGVSFLIVGQPDSDASVNYIT